MKFEKVHNFIGMTIDEANFIVKHYYSILGLQKNYEFRKRVLALNLREMRPCEIRRQLWEQGNFLTSDPEILNYLDQEYIQYILAFAAEIREAHPDIIINRCPECRAVARTPTARLCRVCGHKWHEMS